MITIKNRVKKIKIDSKAIESGVKKMLSLDGYKDFDIGILFTTNKTMQKFNNTYRKKDKPTDILSFPYHYTLKAGQKVVVHEQEDKNLGDLIISLEYAKMDAEAKGYSFSEYLFILIAHGIAHLLGYDHITDAQYAKMRKKERALLDTL